MATDVVDSFFRVAPGETPPAAPVVDWFRASAGEDVFALACQLLDRVGLVRSLATANQPLESMHPMIQAPITFAQVRPSWAAFAGEIAADVVLVTRAETDARMYVESLVAARPGYTQEQNGMPPTVWLELLQRDENARQDVSLQTDQTIVRKSTSSGILDGHHRIFAARSSYIPHHTQYRLLCIASSSEYAGSTGPDGIARSQLNEFGSIIKKLYEGVPQLVLPLSRYERIQHFSLLHNNGWGNVHGPNGMLSTDKLVGFQLVRFESCSILAADNDGVVDGTHVVKPDDDTRISVKVSTGLVAWAGSVDLSVYTCDDSVNLPMPPMPRVDERCTQVLRVVSTHFAKVRLKSVSLCLFRAPSHSTTLHF
jgi:hypothetical protein